MSDVPSPTEGHPIEIEPREVVALRKASAEHLLLDCRTAAELERASIEGAVHIPMDELGGRLDELDSHRNAPIVIFCHAGRRSLAVAQALRHHGYPMARSMSGGIHRWSLDVDCSVPTY